VTGGFTIVDESSPVWLRQRIGRLMAAGDTADFAVARIRLAVLDLHEAETAGLRRCRVLLGHLDASTLAEASETQPGDSPAALLRLRAFAASGRVEVRSAGLAAWTPAFAVIRSATGATGLLGAIHFGNPGLVVGPTFTALTTEPGPVALLTRRFDELWDRAHDVLPAIRDVINRAHALGSARSG
jgi:hypothetical protein